MRDHCVDSISKDKNVFYYYLALLAIQIAISNPNFLLPNIARFIFMGMMFLPLYKNIRYFPFIVACFAGVSSLSFSPILPTNGSFLFAISAIIFLPSFNQKHNYEFLLFFTFCAINNLIYGYIDINVYVQILSVLMCSTFIRDKKDLDVLSLGLILSSLTLSIIFFINKNAFVATYSYAALGLERYSWINPNLLSGSLGTGLVLASMRVLNIGEFQDNKITRIISIATICFSFAALVLNASRGALLASSLSICLLLLLSKVSIKYKLLITLIGALLIIYLWDSGFFKLIEARVNEDTLHSGGDRLNIWKGKISRFLEEGNIVDYLVGLGQEGCTNLYKHISTHNDLVTAFIGFGIVGIVWLMKILLYPVFMCKRRYRLVVIALWSYMVVECCVLEWMFRGYIVLFMYFVFIYKFAKINNY